jgi:hypothetical protein
MSRIVKLGTNADVAHDGESRLDANARAPKADLCGFGTMAEEF